MISQLHRKYTQAQQESNRLENWARIWTINSVFGSSGRVLAHTLLEQYFNHPRPAATHAHETKRKEKKNLVELHFQSWATHTKENHNN